MKTCENRRKEFERRQIVRLRKLFPRLTESDIRQTIREAQGKAEIAKPGLSA